MDAWGAPHAARLPCTPPTLGAQVHCTAPCQSPALAGRPGPSHEPRYNALPMAPPHTLTPACCTADIVYTIRKVSHTPAHQQVPAPAPPSPIRTLTYTMNSAPAAVQPRPVTLHAPGVVYMLSHEPKATNSTLTTSLALPLSHPHHFIETPLLPGSSAAAAAIRS